MNMNHLELENHTKGLLAVHRGQQRVLECRRCKLRPKINKRWGKQWAAYCRECTNETSRIYRARNLEKVRKRERRAERKHIGPKTDRRLQMRYGISLSQYHTLLENQGGVCCICKSAPNGKALHVDHCHKTREVRGLLCNKCNLGIGSFHDNRRLLSAALQYIAQPRFILASRE